MYPPGFATTVSVKGLSDRWEGVAFSSQPHRLSRNRAHRADQTGAVDELTIAGRLQDLFLAIEAVGVPATFERERWRASGFRFWLSSILEAARSGTADYGALCDRMDQAIAKVIDGLCDPYR